MRPRPAPLRLFPIGLIATCCACLTSAVAPGVAQAAPLVVSDLGHGVSAADLGGALVGSGVTISNVTYTGDQRAAGTFTGGAGSIGFDSGIVLDSGKVQTDPADPACSRGVEGPNACSEAGGSDNTTSFGTAGDDALAQLAGQSTSDAAILEFDFVPQASTAQFRYVFSSEEYNNFANTSFNDVFGFFVNGANCALVPGTTEPVSVNTINAGNPGGDQTPHHPELFRDNVRPMPTIDTQMDGLTVVLTCTASVTPGVSNHMKLAIADASDSSLDSAVFIQAASLVSADITLTPASAQNPTGTDHTVTATVRKAGAPQAGKTVAFSVDSGPNAGKTASGVTSGNGQTTFTYHDDGGPGTDTISAAFTPDTGPQQKVTATKTWTGAGPPTASIATPADGATYAFGQVVNASYACAAAAGGTLQSCTGPVADGSPLDTGTAGVHFFTVTATDTDGQTATATSTYTTVGAKPPPAVSSLAPTSGPTTGGAGVLVFGSDLGGASAVRFGPTAGTVVSVNAAGTQLTALAPAGSGTVDVTVTTTAGTSPTSAADRYTYVPPQPARPTAGSGATTGGATTGGATTGGAATGGPTGGAAAGAPAQATPAAPLVSLPTSPGGAVRVIDSSSVEFTATINSRGLPTTMHFEYTVPFPGASAAAITYDARTPEQLVGSDFANHTVTARVAGLVPNTTYHVRPVAANAAGVTPGSDTTFRTATDPPPPPPVLGKTVNAEPVSGIVYVLLPGKGHVSQAHSSAVKGVGFIPLTEARQLPVGTIFDATVGVAKLTTATSSNATQSGTFGAGLFRLLQDRRQRGLATLSLVIRPSALKKCATASGAQAQTAAKKALPATVLTLLHATAKGRFQTRGRYSSATVRGTSWTTSDRCDGTLTKVTRGVVVVSDVRRHQQIVVRAGKSYLARRA